MTMSPPGNDQKDVARLAYEMWQQRGCPFGSPEVDWFAAEQAMAASRTESEADLSDSTVSLEPNEGPWQ